MESPLQKAIKTMSQLPGLGPRSAQRAVLFALKNDGLCLNQLISDLISARDSVKRCSICANLDCGEICSICLDQKRESHQLCIVENVSDLWAIERSHFFKGKYHVLGGALSAIEGVNPAKLNTQTLSNRIEIEEITEIIIALSATIEGQTTTYYIADLLSGKNLKISALALGIPMGGELNYLDDGTISAAFLDRRDIRPPESTQAA